MNEFRIVKSEKCWILQRLTTEGKSKKTGEPSQPHFVAIGYFGKLSDLAIYLLDKAIVVPDSDLSSQVEAILSEIKRVERLITEVLIVTAKGE